MNEERIHHPAHYGGDTVYEAIKVIEAWGLGFCLGNTLKYLARAGKKEPARELEDLQKARWYLDRHIRTLQNAPAAVRPLSPAAVPVVDALIGELAQPPAVTPARELPPCVCGHAAVDHLDSLRVRPGKAELLHCLGHRDCQCQRYQSASDYSEAAMRALCVCGHSVGAHIVTAGCARGRCGCPRAQPASLLLCCHCGHSFNQHRANTMEWTGATARLHCEMKGCHCKLFTYI